MNLFLIVDEVDIIAGKVIRLIFTSENDLFFTVISF